MATKKILRLILGDQLNIAHSWFNDPPHTAEYILMEVRAEAEYVRHHIQKVVAFFVSIAMIFNIKSIQKKKLKNHNHK